jgi:hypothetical protein
MLRFPCSLGRPILYCKFNNNYIIKAPAVNWIIYIHKVERNDFFLYLWKVSGHIFVLGVSNLPLNTISLLNFRTVSTVRYFLVFIFNDIDNQFKYKIQEIYISGFLK